MYEKYLIQTQGFRNVSENGSVVGFEVSIRLAYYRGIALTLINGLKLIVDGEVFEGEQLRLRVAGRSFSMAELAREEQLRWEFDQSATLRVSKAGGLAPGSHRLQVLQTIKPAYIPGAGFIGDATKEMTLGPEHRPASKIKLGVSLYSYQEEFYTRAMSLEDCVAEVSAIGAQGVQLIPEQMMPNYPNPPAQWVERWHQLMQRHGTRPTLIDTFVDVDCGGHRRLSIKEGVEQLVTQMKLAKSLGFGVIRPTTGPVAEAAPELIREALPHAEELDVRIAPEIHAPITLKGKYIESYLELIAKTNTRHLGLTLDLGIFCKRFPPPALALARRLGVQPAIVDFLDRSFREGSDARQVLEQVVRMGANEVDQKFARTFPYYGPSTNQPQELRAIIPYIFNIHGKFYEINTAGVEESIPYDEIIQQLVDGGYSGYIDSEYEGQRLTQDAFTTDSCEQVRRHHLMLDRALKKAQAH